MPLSTVCVSVVSNRPRRTWSASNILNKDVRNFMNMNSAEDITVYKDPPFRSPGLQRRTLGCSYDFPEKTYKKDKKWSISNIFRRKKKDDSETSSDEDQPKKNFLGRRKRKSDNKRKKAAKPAPFDHVVIPPGSRNSLSYNGYNYHEESAIMSDPTVGFSNYIDRALPQIPPQKLDVNQLSESISGSADSVRRSRREQAKARAEARRTSSKNGTSSEDESRISNSSMKIRSEENLKMMEKQMNKRSRAARTERYLKRHSRDGENPHNYLRISKSDVENRKYSDDSNRSPSRSPLVPRAVTPAEDRHKFSFSSLNSQDSNISGLSTIPPSNGVNTKYRVSNSTSNPNYKPPQSMNDYHNSLKKYPVNFKSVSCDDNIHKSEILHVQFPIIRPKRGFRNLSLIDASQLPSMRHPPPPPPPRDLTRTIGPGYFETGRPNTYYFDNSDTRKSKSFTYSHLHQEQQNKKNNLYRNYRSTSEDQLARNTLNVPLQTRPSSTTPESNHTQRLFVKNEETKPIKEEYNYLTDKKPRSRKPIFIKTGNQLNANQLNANQLNANQLNANKLNASKLNASSLKDSESSNKALNFWKEIERQTALSTPPIVKKNRSPSPQMFSSHTHVQTKIFLPNPTQTETNPLTQNNERISSVEKDGTSQLATVTKEDIKRKSSNLEEALNELEAIYNSLKLGDEDLLERAEQKEKEAIARKLESLNTYPSHSTKGAFSDSSFSYEPFDTVDSPRRKRMSKKSHNLKLDDMAYRKINKDRANTIGDPQSVVSQVSYLMRSPVFSRNPETQGQSDHAIDEPDITLDDVVYRNVKHSNSLLKVIEPQPPFGIPLGPITPGANSDYLHAKPEYIYKPSFKHKKIPDIVKDDLAFRNLRKDSNKGPALPPLSNEDFSNNNSEVNLKYLKKKRAQRSMSANIGNILSSNGYESNNPFRDNGDVENSFKNLTDIADAMEIARQVLKEKENKISATKKAFMSDTDASYLQSYNSTRENRLNFLNELRGSNIPASKPSNNFRNVKKSTSRLTDHLNVPSVVPSLSPKPPRGLTPERRRSPKESTPIPVSPLEDKRYANSESTSSSLDDLLNALAEEAKETTERITKELKKLSDEKENSKNEAVDQRLSEIDAVSQKAKLCDKLLQNVVDSKELITTLRTAEEEEVRSIHEAPVPAESATVVMSRFEPKDEGSVKNTSSEEHDYENLVSDQEVFLELNEVEQKEDRKCLSPFEEHKADLIASFQELKEKESLYDNVHPDQVDQAIKAVKAVTVNLHSKRPRLSRWLRFCSHGNLQDYHLDMSNNQESRTDRIARYKEERRRQLAEQFSSYQSPLKTTKSRTASSSLIKDGTSSSTSDSPRPTRTSKLRAAALSQENVTTQNHINITEKSPTCDTNQSELKTVGSRHIDRDKSYKRKSNLNRSLNSEEVPSPELSSAGDVKDRRRRRRFFPAEIFDSVSTSGFEKEQSDTHTTASLTSPTPTSNTAINPSKLTHKKSELSMHMENARRSVTSPFSEMGKYKPYAKRVATSPKSSTTKLNVDKTNVPDPLNRLSNSASNHRAIASDDEKTKAIANRMEGLSALTKQTLARVERLTSKTRDSPKKEFEQNTGKSPDQKNSLKNSKKTSSEKSLLFSILKKNSSEEAPVGSTDYAALPCANPTVGPVSILKRKVSQDNNKLEHTPPVTFSPSVLEPSTTSRRKQGILKKRRSLDESSVMRHRSCSPDVVYKTDSRSILKNQRRSSLEELRRIQSPETHLHSILKRRSSKYDDDDQSLSSPQSILKRRSGASSASSTGSTPHVSITTAVILAAAGGAEMVLDSDGESVRPILKKKSFSEEHTHFYDFIADVPKPILKKKSSTDTDDSEERPRPILKLPRTSLELEMLEYHMDSRSLKLGSSSETECEVRPILKQTNPREEPLRRLSFRADYNSNAKDDLPQRTSRRSNTICTDFKVDSYNIDSKEEDRLMTKPRPFSVHDLVMSLEQSSSTGAIPKKSQYKRNCDRYKTQPVTINELEASRILAKSSQPFNDNQGNLSRSGDSHSLLDFTSSLEKDDSHMNSFFSSSMHNQDSPESITCGKMSSDSAFQSLGDGLELEQVDEHLHESEHEYNNLENRDEVTQNNFKIGSVSMDTKKMEASKENVDLNRYRTRRSGSSSQFLTQPVTSEEIKAATELTTNTVNEVGDDISEHDPCKIPFGDRLKMFREKINQNENSKSVAVKRNHRSRTRYSTDVITQGTVESARSLFRKNFALGQSLQDDKKINLIKNFSDNPSEKSSMRNHNSANQKRYSTVGASTDKDDEGISCNDSDSSSDSGTNMKETSRNEDRRTRKKESKLDSTSEGESSGGREIRSIFKNENRLKIKPDLDGVLLKSKSQDSLRNDPKLSPKSSRSKIQNDMPQAIADLRAKLQERGESGWKKRVSLHNNASDELKMLKEKNKYNDEMSEKSLLSAKKVELDAASRQWQSRVEKSDAEKFSVAGKMSNKIRDDIPTINIPAVKDAEKKPQLKRFKLKKAPDSTPTSPEKTHNCDLVRSKSLSYSASFDYTSTRSEAVSNIISKKSVTVFNPNDVSLESFFKKVDPIDNKEQIDFSVEDLDGIQREPLLVIKKNVQVPKRKKASKNPIKALASRTDISNEYVEIFTGVAEREKKRLNIEKLAKNSNKALEALAGLASTEDFKSIALKKSSEPIGQVPWKDIMLLQVKGRRHVQTRLVEPSANSINEGDNYILIAPKAVYTYTGAYSNVIEQSRMADIVNHIKKSGDLGCKFINIVPLSATDKTSKQASEFWKILGAKEVPETIEAGHPDEDETYESNILLTNMIYALDKSELVPYDKCWGSIPKVEMLKNTNIFVFDFGSEMYVWSGKNAPLDKKKVALKLAKEMWEEGYNYSDCNVCPLNVATMLGARAQKTLPSQGNVRPKWALFAKLTQHRETILFKEKFLDWPDFSRIIRIKSDENLNKTVTSFDIRPYDVKKMLKESDKEPDLVVENVHMGRGDQYFDEETKRLFCFETLNVTGWKILEYTYEKLAQESIGQLYDGNSYIFRWDFKQTVRGRELSGNPSKHAAVGRDRCIFFYWQGTNSSTTEKGAAALLTVELDKQNAPQIRIAQGSEPAAFLQLFNGNMVVHRGKRDTDKMKSRMFILRGERENETYLMEVPLAMASLRSRASCILFDTDNEQIVIWHGIKSKNINRKNVRKAVDNLLKNRPPELHIDHYTSLNVIEIMEGCETEDFLNTVGNDKESYYSLLDFKEPCEHTIRLFKMCSLTGEFVATELLCPHRSDNCSPYPFVQSDLYSASQPALFLIDNHYELWLWQGFWPETETEDDNLLFDQTGSGAVRWQAERKAAMQTAVNYWEKKHGDLPLAAYLVSAGLEPVAFKNLFPAWENKLDVTKLQKKEENKDGELLPLQEELALLSRTIYPLMELLQRPLPEGVDPTNIEKYLSPEDFQKLLSMTRDEFDKLPPWKKTTLKKEKGLF